MEVRRKLGWWREVVVGEQVEEEVVGVEEQVEEAGGGLQLGPVIWVLLPTWVGSTSTTCARTFPSVGSSPGSPPVTKPSRRIQPDPVSAERTALQAPRVASLHAVSRAAPGAEALACRAAIASRGCASC
ncbi:unnamed protein product [Arctogadus glacialis]